MHHLEVQKALAEIAALLGLSPEGRFKAEAYQRGAQIVGTIADELPALVASDRLTEIEGIGASLSTQITELSQTGSSTLLERLRAQYPKGAAQLSELPGMTLRRIRAVHDGLGVTSLEELAEACREQRVRALPGFGPKTEQRLLDALRERAEAESGPARMLLPDAQRLAAQIVEELRATQAVEQVWPTGALRRGEEVIEQLELVVVGERERARAAVAALSAVARYDRESAQALLRSGIPLLVHIERPDTAGAALLYRTGPAPHVELLVARAAERGLTLSEQGLAAQQGALHEASAAETALYRVLGLPEVPPEVRHLPLDPDGYADLIDTQDVLGMVHCHTTYSDGKASIEEMALAAQELGMQYITITDHSPSAHYARGVAIDRLKEQWDEIAAVQERCTIRILRGTESDILADGGLDYPDAMIEQLDVVIASIHSRLRMNRAQMTERLVRAMEQPVFKIWGHALGRLLLKRDPIDCDVERVLDALASSRGAVEVNGDPHRLDLPPHWLPAAKQRGIPFVLSVDAHSTNGLRVLPLAVTMARRGGLRRSDVLNTLPAHEFMARVKA